jgi:hypothetical protein
MPEEDAMRRRRERRGCANRRLFPSGSGRGWRGEDERRGANLADNCHLPWGVE